MLDRYPDQHQRTRTVWWLAFAVITLLLVVGLAILLMRGSSNTESSTNLNGPSPTSATRSSGPGGGTRTCPTLKSSPANQPVTAPAARWVTRGIVTVPISVENHGESVNGPAEISDGQPMSCFAHTPTGAVFAASAAAADSLNPATAESWARNRGDGPGHEVAVRNAAALSPSESINDRTIRVIGFRLLDCAARSRCSLMLASQVTLDDGSQAIFASPVTMTWSDGDWLTYQPEPSAIETPQPLDPSALPLNGYLTWTT